MRLTGRYTWDREMGRMVKVSDKVPATNPGSIMEVPFAQQVLQGYKNAAKRGPLRNGWKPETIKRVWGNA